MFNQNNFKLTFLAVIASVLGILLIQQQVMAAWEPPVEGPPEGNAIIVTNPLTGHLYLDDFKIGDNTSFEEDGVNDFVLDPGGPTGMIIRAQNTGIYIETDEGTSIISQGDTGIWAQSSCYEHNNCYGIFSEALGEATAIKGLSYDQAVGVEGYAVNNGTAVLGKAVGENSKAIVGIAPIDGSGWAGYFGSPGGSSSKTYIEELCLGNENNCASDFSGNPSPPNHWTLHANGNDIFNNNSNYVGIGTTDPAYKLDVVGDIFTTTHLLSDAWYGTTGRLGTGQEVWIGNTNDSIQVQGELCFGGDQSDCADSWVSNMTNLYEEAIITVDSAGWKRVAHIDGSVGRGQNTVTIYTTGGSYATRSSKIRWFKSWDDNGGLTIMSEYGETAHWTEARVTTDGTNSYLEIYFPAMMDEAGSLRTTLQYEGGFADGELYSGVVPAGGGTILATADMGLLNVGSNSLFVGSNGGVGVGLVNNSTSNKLVIQSNGLNTDVVRVISKDGDTSLVDLSETSGEHGLVDIQDSSGATTIRLHGGSHSFINNAGNFGVGTASPSYKLEVAGTVFASSTLIAGKDLVVVNDAILLGDIKPMAAICDPDQILKKNNTDPTWRCADDEGGSGTDSDWVIDGNDMYSGVSGNVGIGNNNPAYKLDVTGDIFTTTHLLSDAWYGTTGNGGPTGGIAQQIWVGDNNDDIQVQGEICFGTDDSDCSDTWPSGTGFWELATDGINYPDGNVGIGITTPIAELHVSGSIIAEDDLTFHDEIKPDGLYCTEDQILKRDGGAPGAGTWRCADDEGGSGVGDDWGDQAVVSENSLAGDGTTLSPLAVDIDECTGESSIKKINTDGTVVCETDDGGSGTGDDWGLQVVESLGSLTGTGILGDELGVVGWDCANPDEYITTINPDGTFVCETDYFESSVFWQAGTNSSIHSTNAGNVGVGLENPNSKLHVYDNTQNAEIDIQTGGLNHWGIYQDSDSDLNFWNSGSDNLLTLSDNGNVGISDTDPDYELDVNGTIAARDNLIFHDEIMPDGVTCGVGQILKRFGDDDWQCAEDIGTTGGDGYIGQNDVGVHNAGNDLNMLGYTLTVERLSPSGYTCTDGQVLKFNLNGDLVCGTDEGGTGFWEAATGGINYADGNVGINDSSPDYELDVNGTLYATGDIIAVGTIAANQDVVVGNNLQLADDILLGSYSCEYNQILKKTHIGNGNGTWSCADDEGSVDLWSPDTYGINYSDGNVGVGSESLPDYKLFVADSLSAASDIDAGRDINAEIDINAGGNITADSNIRAWGDIRFGFDIIPSDGDKCLDGQILQKIADFTWDCVDISGGGLWTLHGNGQDIYREDYNVGIGTTDPGKKLEVSGEAKPLRLSYSGIQTDIGPNNGTWSWFDTTATGGFYFADAVVVDGGQISSYDEDLELRADFDASASDNQLYLKTDGNVGIGTNTPDYKLDINGDVFTNTHVLSDAWYGTTGPSGPGQNLWIGNSNDEVQIQGTAVFDEGPQIYRHEKALVIDINTN